MPEASKNISIGVLVAIALGLLLWVLLFLHPSFGDGKFRLHVRFQDIEKVNIGTRVTYAGRAVGEVVKIEQVPEEDRMAGSDPDDIYIYDLTVAIDSHIPLYDSDEITVGTSGLMGERFISVIPKRPSNHTAHPIAYNEVVYSSKPPSMNDAFTQVSKLATKAEETMGVLASLVNENRKDFDETLDALKGAASQLNTLLAQANETKMVANLSEASFQIGRTMSQTQELLAKISNGDGTLGKFMVNDDLYIKSLGVMDKMNILMNDVNDYGVLFHLDKTWQRDRKMRLDELAKKDQENKTIADQK